MMAGAYNAGSIVYEVDMETAKLIVARREVDAALSGMSGSMGRLEASVSKTEKSISSMEGAVSSLTGVAKGLLAALSVHQVAEWGNEWVTVNNKLVNSVRTTEQLADVTQRVFDIAQSTRSGLEATATLYGRLERSTRSAGTSTKDLITLTSTINKGLAVSGATTEEASSTMTQLSQALASGVLRGEEFNSISENGSRLAVALADSLGVTIGQLRAMAAEGKLTTEVVVNGLLKQSDAIAKEFSNTATTMSQAFTIATNNITKFVGESATVSTGIKAFNSGIISLSQNLDTISAVLITLTAAMGSRFAGALAMATAAKLKDTAATIASAKASEVAAKDAELEASAKLRLANVEKAATIQTLQLAEGRLATMRSTQASVAAEVQLAEAESASIRTTIAQIESEKALEAQRLRAQITDQGRVATATRMAQLQQASAALNTRLAAAEAATAEARAAAIASAEASVSAARLAAADATGVATAANGRYIASQEASVIATRAASTSLGLLRGALGLVGGPAGVAMLAGAAIFYFWQQSQQAKQEAISFADGVDRLTDSLKAMSNTSLRGTIADANTALRGQQDVVSDLKDEIAELTRKRDEAEASGKKYGTTIEQGNGLLLRAAQLTDQINQKQRDLENTESKLANTTKLRDDAQVTLSNNMLTAMGIHDKLIERGTTLERVQGAVAKAFGTTADEINRATQAGQEYNPKSLQVSPATPKGDEAILGLEQQNELLKIQDERLRAVIKAGMEQAKVTNNPNQIAAAKRLAGENFDLQQAEDARKKAASDAESQAKRSASSAESVAEKLAKLKEQSELAGESTRQLSRDQAILTAQQSLGASATPEQVKLAGEYAAAKWDTGNAIRAQAAAEKLLPEARENASYKQDLEDLKTALSAKKITQQQADATAEQLEKQHQINIAKIRAQQAVSTAQEAVGNVDPVQQLANQNAQKMALIQQFEQQRLITEQQGLALRNAANTEYEQQRIAAQWQIYKAQNDSNELLGTAIESLGGGATNAITGLLNGTQSLSQAFANLGTSVLNGLVSSLVEMGVRWVESAVMGQAAQATAIASNQATAAAALATSTATGAASAAALLAAYSPAAMAASIATSGGAAAAGLTGYTTAMTAAQTMSLAGMREHGGPVNANSMYRVGEGGKPEIFKASNGSQYMIPGDNGSVISNRDIGSTGGAGGGLVMNFNFDIQTTGGVDEATQKQMAQMMQTVAIRTIKDQQRPSGLLSKGR
ncbi:tape measure protein [Pantoea eucalypti]|uniref:tape measure protein n=1 Tax=Pantoea eucalypti TaxID=470933 RepID=UPI0024BBB6ED|nr:tape measure protein [Pantoea eucalypti]MDJ0473816.1 tape measure protein [Pantoea eucalypti]